MHTQCILVTLIKESPESFDKVNDWPPKEFPFVGSQFLSWSSVQNADSVSLVNSLSEIERVGQKSGHLPSIGTG